MSGIKADVVIVNGKRYVPADERQAEAFELLARTLINMCHGGATADNWREQLAMRQDETFVVSHDAPIDRHKKTTLRDVMAEAARLAGDPEARY